MQNMMLSWQQSAGLTAGLSGIATGLRLSPSVRTRWATSFVTEASIIGALYTIWQFAGQLSLMGTSDAYRRGRWLSHVERALSLPDERAVQDLALGHHALVELANLYYDVMHFTVMFVFLLWLFVRRAERYSAVRTTLAVTTLVCLVIQLVPVAPPRLLSGYVDTAAMYGQSVYAGDLAGQLFAMPSMHVTWAVLVGWYAYRLGVSRWRFLGPAHAVITVFVVVATGNHWWLDGIVGVVVLIACAWSRFGVVRALSAMKRARTPTAALAGVGSSGRPDECVSGKPAVLRPPGDGAGGDQRAECAVDV